MKKLYVCLFTLLFSSHLVAQEAAPTNTSAGSSIPVVSVGSQIQPLPPKDNKTTPKAENNDTSDSTKATATPQKQRNSAPKRAVKVRSEEPKHWVLESKQLVHSRLSQVGDTVQFTLADPSSSSVAKYGPVIGKIETIQKMKKDEPGIIRIKLDSLGVSFDITREKGSDNIKGKEVFMPVLYQKELSLNRRALQSLSRYTVKSSRGKNSKNLLTASAELENPQIDVKLADLKYPTRLFMTLEPSGDLKVENIKTDSLKIVRVNDYNLVSPIEPQFDKIKVADYNKNGIKDLKIPFSGLDLVRNVAPGSSRLYLEAETIDGKTIEAVAKVVLEYR